jgi:chemotaxis regulatin CheY-phosphate phosphatase CheZ
MVSHANRSEQSAEALVRACEEICSMLRELRRSRDSLRQVAGERLRHTTEKLREVSTATEVAATDILDRLDRALGIVDELDTLDTSGQGAGLDARNRLRDELFMAQGGLQFQDITAQQLAHATLMIEQLEGRLATLAEQLDPRVIARAAQAGSDDSEASRRLAFSPQATMTNPEQRQALVDSIFEAPAA